MGPCVHRFLYGASANVPDLSASQKTSSYKSQSRHTKWNGTVYCHYTTSPKNKTILPPHFEENVK